MEGLVLGDRYELLEKIGEGGMATVYKAHCRILDRIVAVKILKEELSNNKSFVEKFRIEALAAARISHPNIVNIYDVGQQDDIYYIVMEYVEGKTLNEFILEKAPLPVSKAIDIAIMICDGVHYAHEKGVIHRDIKPHNILITDTGIVKVADFGIARAISSATITFGGNMVGSVHYISPEQAKGEPVNRTTDIYSIGCVLYEMITGKVPFDAESPITVALKHIHDEVPSPKSFNDAIPQSLEGIIQKAMQKIPAYRFSTAEEMRNVLLNLHNDSFSNYGNRNEKTIIMSPIADERGKNNMKKKKKLRPANLALAIVAILGLLSGALFMMSGNIFGKEVVVPDIENMDIKEADQKLSEVGLKMNVIAEQYDEEIEKDKVISQEPGKGQKVKKGREIKVIISKGAEMQKVPNVVGYDINEAEILLRNKGLRCSVEETFDDRHEEGEVISQYPEAGERIAQGGRVKVVVSKGAEPDRVSMPNLEGMSVQDARKKLSDNNLILVEDKRQESNEYYADQIISQDPKPGVRVNEKSDVKVVVSKGPGPVAQMETIEFTLPDQQDYYRVVIRVKDSRGEREVYNQMHQASDTVYAGISHSGSGKAEVLLNNRHYKTFTF